MIENRGLVILILVVGAWGLVALGMHLGSDPQPEPRIPLAAEIDAAVVVDATVIEMRGYGPDGKPGEFLFDCERGDPDAVLEGKPSLICTQREEP